MSNPSAEEQRWILTAMEHEFVKRYLEEHPNFPFAQLAMAVIEVNPNKVHQGRIRIKEVHRPEGQPLWERE